MRLHEFLTESITIGDEYSAKNVLAYIKNNHHDWNSELDQHIRAHSTWQLKMRNLAELTPQHVDQDYAEDLADTTDFTLPKFHPPVVDTDGYIFDGNHRTAAAQLKGLKAIPVLEPK